jgi:hypothetical protein
MGFLWKCSRASRRPDALVTTGHDGLNGPTECSCSPYSICSAVVFSLQKNHFHSSRVPCVARPVAIRSLHCTTPPPTFHPSSPSARHSTAPSSPLAARLSLALPPLLRHSVALSLHRRAFILSSSKEMLRWKRMLQVYILSVSDV